MPATNGLAFSPDEKYLYVNGGRDNYVNRYEVQGDGSLANGKLFIDMRGRSERGITDGLRVDIKGNLYETGPGGGWGISPEGKHRGTIRRQAGRRDHGAADRAAVGIEGEHVAILRRGGKLDDGRDVCELSTALRPELHQDPDQAVVEPVALHGLERVERTGRAVD